MLSVPEQRAITALEGHVVKATVGHDLVKIGQKVETSVLVVAGNVGRFEETQNGTRQITAIYMAGDMCNLESLVAPKAKAGLAPLGNCTVLAVPLTDLQNLMVRYPNIGLALWRDSVMDASVLSKWFLNVGRKDARARTAHLFCELGVRMERATLGKRESYQLDMNQGQIADTVGITSVHVNRTLQGLKADGVMTLKGHRVIIEDWTRLSALAEFSPTYLLCG